MVRGRGARDNIEPRGPEKLSAALTFPHHLIKIFGLFKYINESSENADSRIVGGRGGGCPIPPLATHLYTLNKRFLL